MARTSTILVSLVYLITFVIIGLLSQSCAGPGAKREIARLPAQDALARPREELQPHELMAEIVQYPYHDSDAALRRFGPEVGESTGSRIDFDDVDDYHLWTESPTEEKDGTAYPGHAGWRRDVVVTTHTMGDGTGFVLFPTMELKRIEVTVTDPNGKTHRLTALRSNAGLNDQLPSVTTTYLSWIGAKLQIGPDAAGSIETGVGLQNQVIISQGP